ncbi:MAG: 3-isopropylmalate dehydratase large subunit [Bacteroidales bacterium]|nr:3-isopropylmalate dehydratase large subunit [Bacteroidales bacterium]
MNLIENIIANHSKFDQVKPGDIVDIEIDARAARDFGGPNVVKNMEENNLTLDDPSKTLFTFDTNPTGSDQKYAINQQIVRIWARKHGVKIYDIDNGIGTHTMINEGIVVPGATSVTTDSHANILGAIGAFGQGMGDQDIAAAFSRGKVWFKVPESVKLNFNGKLPTNVTPKDFILNLLNIFGANQLLGYSVELYGDVIDQFSLSDRITIASMGTEMGVIILLFPPNDEIMKFSEKAAGRKLEKIMADENAVYAQTHDIDVSDFKPMVSNPGAPHDTSVIPIDQKIKIDSAFVGSCTNGRMEDMRAVAEVLKGKKVAPGVVLKIVPSTDDVWRQCMDEGIFTIFKDAGALISNAGCAGCAAGQVGQNGPGEITMSTGNRNFPGKQGKGSVYLASPASVAASAVAGFVTDSDNIPDEPMLFTADEKLEKLMKAIAEDGIADDKPTKIEGRVWYIKEDNIDTDMIFHNRYLAITDINEMGQYTFDNLEGYEDFSKKAKSGDIVIVPKNFGSGSSRQQAVDCFKALGVQAVIAESFGAIYERNAINAAFPIMTYDSVEALKLEDGDVIKVDFETGKMENTTKSTSVQGNPFSEVQLEIYQNGGLF